MARAKKSTRAKPKKDAVVPKPSRTIVTVRESANGDWSEAVDLSIMSRFGAGFSLSRECPVGQLIHLHIPSSKELMALGYLDVTLSVVCLVQQCTEVTISGKPAFHIGVLFAGRTFPASYDANPHQCYRACGTDDEGFFKIKDVAAQFKSRRHPRFRIELEVSLLLISKMDRSIVKANGVTYDIGASGASVICTLDANPGDKIKFGCREIDFHGIAVVRNRRNRFGLEDHLHLEFLDAKLPIERVLFGPVRPSIVA
jgi:hypothetical protein